MLEGSAKCENLSTRRMVLDAQEDDPRAQVSCHVRPHLTFRLSEGLDSDRA
jgi:hypothetical protein